MIDDLDKFMVNQPTWNPNAYLLVRRRYFQREDGHVFAVAMTEDYHIRRLQINGWKEVSGPEAEPEELRAAARAQHAEQISHAKDRARDVAQADSSLEAHIAALMGLVERQAQMIESLVKPKELKEPKDAVQTNDAPVGGGSPRPDRKSPR